MSSVKRDNFTSFVPVFISYNSSFCLVILTRISSVLLSMVVRVGILVQSGEILRILLCYLPWVYMIKEIFLCSVLRGFFCVFLIDGFFFFLMNGCWFFSNASVLSVVILKDNGFEMLTQLYIPGINPTWSWCVTLFQVTDFDFSISLPRVFSSVFITCIHDFW